MKRWHPHLFTFFVVATLSLTGALCALQDTLTDWRFRSFPRKATGEVVVVAIDARSIETLGVWPWPRSLHAELLAKLRAAGAAEVAFDVDFSSRAVPAGDEAFLNGLQAFGGSAVLPIFKQVGKDRVGERRVYSTRPLPEFAAHAWLATVNVIPESSGQLRRYPLGETIANEYFPSLAALLGGRYDRSSRSFLLDHSIKVSQIPSVSVVDVLSGKIDASRLMGRKVIIGATAIELGDRFNVPVAGIVSGVELQALATEAILQDRMLAKTGLAFSLLGLAVLGGLMLAMWRRLGPGSLTIVLGVSAIVIEGAASLVQSRAPIIADTSYWMAALASYLVALWLTELDLRKVLAKVAQHRFQSIAVSLGDGVVCIDADGLISFWNPAAEKIFNYSAAELAGRPFGVLYEKNDDLDPHRLLSLCDGAQGPIELIGVRKNGDRFPLELSLSSWIEGDGRHRGAIVRDISSRKHEEERILYLALHDPLTGLSNRAALGERMKEGFERARQQQACVAVLLIDLDNFKEINDTLGHDGGDRFLRTFAGRLQECVGSKTPVARLGGDEFVILIEGADAEKEAGEIAHSIAEIFGDHYTYVEGSAFLVSASAGSAVFPRDGNAADELLANADLALYRAKKQGRGTHVRYASSFKQELDHRRTLEAELRRAVEKGELELFYQPQVRLCDASLIGVEALIRWHHPTRGLLLPGQFLQVLHSNKLSELVGTWVLRTACRQAKRWQTLGLDISMGVNVLPSQFRAELPEQIQRVLAETGLTPSLLEVEITENILLNEDANALELLQQIRNIGVRVALDDFGTGYASLSSLKRFQLDRLKIDRSFVSDLGTDHNNMAIVNAVVELGKRLGLSTIAEGIEDEGCVELLERLGCEQGQGYHFGKPMPANQIDELFIAAQTYASHPQATAA